MPMSADVPAGCGKNLLDGVKEALWLVSYFESHLVEKNNERRRELGWKLIDEFKEDRKQKWFHPGLALVQDHGLPEVVSVIDWVFGTHSGLLPYRVENQFSHAYTVRDRKLTSLRQLEFHFSRLVEEMAKPQCSGVVEATDFTDQVIRDSTGGVNYGQAFSDPAEEAKVTELVTMFAEFRAKVGITKEFPARRTWSWAKSFRIMLASRGYDFDDLKMVITTLRDCNEMDGARYHEAFDLQRDGLDYLKSAAQLALRMAEMRSAQRPQHRREDRSQGRLGHSTTHWQDFADYRDIRRRRDAEDDDDIGYDASQREMIGRLMGTW